jgi:predicted small lipoprotein YifL
MTGRSAAGVALALICVAGCGDKGPAPRASAADAPVPSDQRDAEALGREVLELVDRAVDYRGSHRGRPASSFRQMGIDTLTPTTVRRLVNVGLDPVVTVSFRKSEAREITSCRGDSQILEESTLNSGRFTLMCTARSGAQRPMQVGRGGEP